MENTHEYAIEIPWKSLDLHAQTESVISARWPKVYSKIMTRYKDMSLPWPQMKWLWEHDMDKPPVCKVCGCDVRWHGRQKGYGVYCSPRCANGDPEKKAYTEERVLQKYGVKNVASLESTKEKRRDTNLERYGVSNVFQNDDIKSNIQDAIRERYGVDWPSQSPEVQEKRRENSIEKYGVDHHMKLYDVKDSVKKSNNIATVHRNDLEGITPDGQWICKCPHPGCDKCEEKTYNIFADQFYARKEWNIEPCTLMLPIQQSRSKDTYIEQFVKNILDENGIAYVCNDRSIIAPLELDIYIPSKKIAIECNGCYWHSWPRKDKKYHMNKWIACNKIGIQLITIWEDQIRRDPDIVHDIILSKLGIYYTRVYARKLKVTDVSPKECSKFLDDNHIQGGCKAKVHLGLVDDDGMLHSVMTFRMRSKVSGGKNDDSWELIRFCSLRGEQVIGAAGKLLKDFMDRYRPEKIVSFSSNDISNGGLYKSLGFECDTEPSMAYWYVSCEDYERCHRSRFMKKNLQKMGMDISNKTEDELMAALPYMKIYDSGHLKWEIKF